MAPWANSFFGLIVAAPTGADRYSMTKCMVMVNGGPHSAERRLMFITTVDAAEDITCIKYLYPARGFLPNATSLTL